MEIAEVRERALRLLVRREHGFDELCRKLVQKGVDSAMAEEAVGYLAEQGLQSDTRFIESFIRQKLQAGWGPLKLQSALAQRGISKPEMTRCISNESVDWTKQAQEVLLQRSRGDLSTFDRQQMDVLHLPANCGPPIIHDAILNGVAWA